MKRRIGLLGCLICFLVSNAQTDKLKGSWGPVDKSVNTKLIEFRSDHTAQLTIEGGTLLIDEYTIEKDGDLMLLELKTIVNGYDAILYMLIEFISDNSMKMELFPPGSEKPTKFTEGVPDIQLILVKRE